MSDVWVESWDHLMDQLYAGSWQEQLGRYRSPSVYRGMSSVDYDLVTSLARLGQPSNELEEHILRAFRKYARLEEPPDFSLWNWLALAQHHGLNTRLLDWTFSPLVAVHFVTENIDRFDRDGVVWCVNHSLTNELLPDRLQRILREEGSSVFTAEMLGRAADSLRSFDRLSDDPFVAFFEPPSLDERIVNQYALFSLISDPRINLADWLANRPDVHRRIIIPAHLKLEIRDKLDQANITERVLYPGLDGLCRWLKRYYTPRPQRRPVPLDQLEAR